MQKHDPVLVNLEIRTESNSRDPQSFSIHSSEHCRSKVLSCSSTTKEFFVGFVRLKQCRAVQSNDFCFYELYLSERPVQAL